MHFGESSEWTFSGDFVGINLYAHLISKFKGPVTISKIESLVEKRKTVGNTDVRRFEE